MDGNCVPFCILFENKSCIKDFRTVFYCAGGNICSWGFRRLPELRLSKTSPQAFMGFSLIFFGLIVYPILTHLTGHSYPAMPTFGLPCPTTIFTIGVLLIAFPSVYQYALVPVLWSVVGSTAAFKLGVTADYGLIAAGICAIPLFLPKRKIA